LGNGEWHITGNFMIEKINVCLSLVESRRPEVLEEERRSINRIWCVNFLKKENLIGY
jgi:hypothetical protein